MTHYKLHLEDEAEDDFILVAIHCSEEAFKMAFMLNKHLSMKLYRKKNDLKLHSNDLTADFSVYEFENEQQYTQYYLVENKCKLVLEESSTLGGLFEERNTEKIVHSYLLPEFKKVDYFLKIESDVATFPKRKLVAQINEIKEVISAYVVENQSIKNQNNLIFN